MTVYAQIESVRRLMAQFVLGASTKPTDAQVETIIADMEQEVTTYLEAANVVVPVTTPQHFVDWLGLLVSYGATAAVLKSMFPSASGPAETPAYAFWESRYKAGLKGLQDGSLIPPTAETLSKKIRPSTYFTRNPNIEENLGTIAEPFFGRSFTG